MKEREERNALQQTRILGNGQAVTRIPFEPLGGLILVTAQLNGSSGSFILDTGAPRLMINTKYLDNRAEHPRQIEAQGIGGGIATLDLHPIEFFDWHGIRIESQEVIFMDFERIETKTEREILGLIGYEVLKEYELLLDYARREITLILPEAFEGFAREHFRGDGIERVPFELQVHLPMIEVAVGRERLKMAVDSGAETSLIAGWLYPRLQEEITESDETELAGTDNLEQVVTVTNIRSMRIGRKTYRDLTTVFSSIGHLEKQLQTRIDGIIGYEILSQQRTLIRYGQNEIWLIPPAITPHVKPKTPLSDE